MKQETQRRNRGKAGQKIGLLALAVLPIFLSIGFTIATVNSDDLTKLTSQNPVVDKLTLIYNNIDAFGFPKIVSLVNVIDGGNLIVSKLDTSNFEVYEDNVRERPIEVVELFTPDCPPNVVLTIDASHSMNGTPLADAKNAAITFVNLMQGEDRSAVVHFNRQAYTDHDFSNNKNSLIDAINSIQWVNGTAIYDALLHSADLLRGDDIKNRVIILLTDGEDNDSYYSYEDVLRTVIPLEIKIFTIGLRINPGTREETVLKNLASETGGLYFYSPSSSDLELIYKAISGILHHRYQISYSTHNPAKDGTLRHVRIEVMVNTSTSWDTASYRAPYEPDPVDPDPVDPDTIKPAEPKFEVLPNPFTPNDDGFNDYTEFKQGDEVPQDWNIIIMDRAGKIIKQLTPGEAIWDGRNKSGQLMLPGSYLYVVSKNNRVIHRGLIQLIR